MTQTFEWQGRVGEAWAEEWRRTDRTLGPVEDALVAEAGKRLTGIANPAILDIGCGAGSTSLALSDAIPGASVIGIDLSDALIAVARSRAEGRPELGFEVADAGIWTATDGRRFDALVSRHGVMFFFDPISAFAHLRELGSENATLTFSCFRARAENSWAAALVPIIAEFAPETLAGPPPPVGPFAFADPDRVGAILTAAGFAAPHFTPFDFAFVAGAGEDPIADALSFFQRIGPFAALIRDLAEPEREAANQRLAEIADAHLIDGRVQFDGAAWIVTCASA